MQRKEPTPSAKCDVSVDQATEFLSDYYSNKVFDLLELPGGKHSRAFSYEHSSQYFIVRFNTEDRCFLKDKYVCEHYSKQILVPKIIELGLYREGIYFCISEKVTGETARDQYNIKDFSSIPLLFGAIEEIAKISPPGKGYGYLDLDCNAKYASSLEYLNSVYHSKDLFDWEEIFKITFVDKDFTDYVSKKLVQYARYSSEQRELLHGDFGADNVFIKDGADSGSCIARILQR